MAETGTGQMVRLQRERRGMSTTALATQSGCTPRHIELIEHGKRTPSLPLLREIAKVLGVRTAILLGEAPRDSHEPSRPQISDIERALFAGRSLEPDIEPPDAEQLSERVAAARNAWFTSTRRYSILMAALPSLVTDAESLALEQTPRSHSVATDAYLLARGVLKHLRRVDLAHLAADRAMRFAEMSGDPLMIAWAYWNLGQSMLSDDMHQIAYDVARRAIEQLEPHVADGDERHVKALGALHLLAAIGEARMGADDAAKERVRGPAARLAERVEDCSGVYDLAFFGPTNVAIHMASIENDIGRPEAVLHLADDIDLRRTPSIERRATHLAQVARACEDLGDDAASLLHLLRIERECPEELDHKLLLREMVRSLARRARPSWAPEVRYLAERHDIPI
ncbi:helix-turn-helix transcriptional regulator [Nonomuraea sp. MG754425]|uniref:helix-turn-helix domain-containing protein n=1 Tax=Nonomuraea sp. MG754425 TaxID=2570319 RepID=UPI001F428ECF|nr:helix-turn-helix transcriptional regulator [Nonomuraea sp. MG754425]MCF6471688.1 helix-turn-helix transcriptional regulator [Nonomuraea sp. MG754425]